MENPEQQPAGDFEQMQQQQENQQPPSSNQRWEVRPNKSLAQLGQQYAKEFEEKYEGIRRRGLQQLEEVQETIQKIQPELQAKQEEAIALIQDMSPVSEGYGELFAGTFAWTAVIMAAYYIASLVTGIVLAPVIGLFVGGATALLLAYVGLPLGYYYVDLNSHTDKDIRFELLGFAVAEGILTGFLLSERYLATMQPLAFVTPLLIGVVGAMAEPQIGTSRVPLLGATIGSGVVAQLALGLIIRQLSFSYILLALSYAAVGLASVQFLVKNSIQEASAGKSYKTMFAYLLASIYVQLVVFIFFSGTKEAMQSRD